MPARWVSFAVGLGLTLAPLVLGYGSAGAILHDVAVGLLVAIGAIAALEWPRARFLLAAPALWLVHVGRDASDLPAVAELTAGAVLVVCALVPSGKRAPHAVHRPGHPVARAAAPL